EVDTGIFGESSRPTDRLQIIEAVAAKSAAMDVPVWKFARHMLGLFHGGPGARDWRRRISAEGRGAHATPAWFVELGAEIAARIRMTA
ncbi:MAG: tRNA dihydrouridine(20/20a) synthase DusA, partial [Pseudomonadota bacterium]